MGWVLTASGAVAGLPAHDAVPAPCAVQSVQQRLERTDLVDGATNARLRLTRRFDGAVQASFAAGDVEFRRVVQPNGDFHVRLAARQDLVVLVRTGNRLRVSRNGGSALVALDQADEDGLDAAQQVLAGSRAARAFRQLASRLEPATLGSAPGVSIDLADAWLALLQGDTAAVGRRAAPGRASLVLARLGGAASCYAEYEGEVVAAWDDFSQCCDDVKWYPGMQEVCAFTWLLRVESAWFRFIACSSFPLKAE